jgi:hypothetical protein
MPTAPTAFGTGIGFTAAILSLILLCARRRRVASISATLVVVPVMPSGVRMRSCIASPHGLPALSAMILPATMYSRLS